MLCRVPSANFETGHLFALHPPSLRQRCRRCNGKRHTPCELLHAYVLAAVRTSSRNSCCVCCVMSSAIALIDLALTRFSPGVGPILPSCSLPRQRQRDSGQRATMNLLWHPKKGPSQDRNLIRQTYCRTILQHTVVGLLIFFTIVMPPFHVSANSNRSFLDASFTNGLPASNNCFVRSTSNFIRPRKRLSKTLLPKSDSV